MDILIQTFAAIAACTFAFWISIAYISYQVYKG